MVKKVLENQIKETHASKLISQSSQTQEDNHHTPMIKVHPNSSFHTEQPQQQNTHLKERNSVLNTTHLMSEIKHMKYDLFGSNMKSENKVSRKLFLNENLNESLHFIRRISDPYTAVSHEETNYLSDKINELENINKNLLIKVSFLEGVVSSGMKNNKHVQILLNKNSDPIIQENVDNSYVKIQNHSGLFITPQKQKEEKEFSKQIVQQLAIMNKKIDQLTKANQDLTEKNQFLTRNIQELQKNNSIVHQQQDSKESVEFWKEKCKVLVDKYFQVIKKLKSDHQTVTEELRRDYNKLKNKVSDVPLQNNQFISTRDLDEIFGHQNQQQTMQKQRSSSQKPMNSQAKNKELRSDSIRNRENIPN